MTGIKVIAIGASTGGADALEAVLSPLSPTSPPIVVAMHLKPGITRLLAARISELTKLVAKEAVSGDFLQQGHVLIAPGGMHMQVMDRGGRLAVSCYTGERVHHVIPSADILFDSVALRARQQAIGVILTGIGADGAQGLLKMRNGGANTIGQDEKSSLVYGMPKVANDIGAVKFQLPLHQIAHKIKSLI